MADAAVSKTVVLDVRVQVPPSPPNVSLKTIHKLGNSMKFSFAYVGLAVMLLGCANDSLPLEEDEETYVEDPTEEFAGGYDDGDSIGSLCDMYQPGTMTVNGMIIEIPVMCDPRPMIDRGDPPLDRFHPDDEVELYENPGDTQKSLAPDPEEQDTSNLI